MQTRPENTPHSADPQAGFALIVALLALVLLTFLGLTLALTSSTELQIASNYRNAQQAYYNAEAGLEVGRAILSTLPSAASVLPAVRASDWDPNLPPVSPMVPGADLDQWNLPLRDYENATCDKRGGGMGYGEVLYDDTGLAMQYVTQMFGSANLNGAFTLWVRRPTTTAGGGWLRDSASSNEVIVTAEGTAPYTGFALDSRLARTNRAVRMLEATLQVGDDSQQCKSGTKSSASSTGFQDPCGALIEVPT